MIVNTESVEYYVLKAETGDPADSHVWETMRDAMEAKKLIAKFYGLKPSELAIGVKKTEVKTTYKRAKKCKEK
jgi:hypothetical protein